MVAPIAPLSSVDTVIRRGDQEENRPTAFPAAFNIHTKEVIANDKLDQLLYYNKRQTDLLEQFLTILTRRDRQQTATPETPESRPSEQPTPQPRDIPTVGRDGLDYVIPSSGTSPLSRMIRLVSFTSQF